MKTLSIDLETYSSVNLQKCGVYKYAQSEDFEILLFGYSVDGGEVKVVDLACGEKIPDEVIKALSDESVIKWAFNATFERVCLSNYLGEWLAPESWHCTLVWSATLGLPLSLEGVGAVLGLEKQKLTEGKALIRYFCVPCSPTKSNGGRTRNLPKHDMEKWQLFKAYNKRDVETEMSIQDRLSRFPVPEQIWDEYHLSEEINDRGIGIDRELVRQAIAIDQKSREQLTSALQNVTKLENPNSVQQMKGWLSDNGLQMDSLGKKEVAAAIKTAPPDLTEVLSLRQQLAKSSVKKYQAMENAMCRDDRARGMFQFYGANRTGRFAGRLIQLQNLPQNHMPDLAEARSLVRGGNYNALELLYEDIPDTLSQLIRTAFVPQEGRKFIVSDFSAIEARVLAWLAGERWRMEMFKAGGDIYCQSASKMFGVPVEKHGINGHLRQKGKIAELACIAEGELVLTDVGLVPIEKVTTEMKLWDGENWVSHDGVIYKGIKEVITYEGLTATADHLVWVEGKQKPIQFGSASTRGLHLVQTGAGGTPIRLGEGNLSGNKEGCGEETSVCTDQMHGMLFNAVAAVRQFTKWKVKGVSELFTAEKSSQVAREENDSCKATMRKSKHKGIQQLWRSWHSLRICKCDRGGTVHDKRVWSANKRYGDRSYRHKRELYTGKSSFFFTSDELYKSAKECIVGVFAGILAICRIGSDKEAVCRTVTGRDNTGCRKGCYGEEKELETHLRKARLYDIRNAGEHHRFTVSGHLVHNCGYGGSVGALKAMGALEMGLTEEELQPLVNDWRDANPMITMLWWDIDRAVKTTVKQRIHTEVNCLQFDYRSGFLFMTLPSGRRLAYVKPRMGVNQFGSESVTYEGVGATKKWERLESYGPKFTENAVQAIARDILMYAMQTLRCCSIVAHVHDELIIECDRRVSLDEICEQMGRTPPWADGLLLRADGYECDFYKKD